SRDPSPMSSARWRLSGLEGSGEQVAGGQAAIGPPLLGDVQDLLLRGEMAESVSGLDRLAQREVTGQDDVFPLQRDEQGTLHRPRTYARNGGELGHQFVVGQISQLVEVQPPV